LQRHAGSFDAVELYSCFPVVPKLARRTLGLGLDHPTSVTGGLSFFGGPLNNYMSHAACAMVREVRAGAKLGLIYGQGEFVTKHHALIVSREPQARDNSPDALIDMKAQAAADPMLGPPVLIDETPEGEGTLETFTAVFDPTGRPDYGAVVARLASGARTLARLPGVLRGRTFAADVGRPVSRRSAWPSLDGFRRTAAMARRSRMIYRASARFDWLCRAVMLSEARTEEIDHAHPQPACRPRPGVRPCRVQRRQHRGCGS
jgi:hypothetical protein